MILVLLDVRLRTDGGSHLLADLLGLLPESPEVVVLANEDWGIFGNLLRRICFNRCVRFAKRQSEWACRLYLWLFYGLFASTVRRRLLARFAGAGARQIWCVSNEILPSLATDLARQFGCPLHVSIHDIPFTYKLAGAERDLLRREMERWLPRITSWDVQSPGMERKLAPELPREGEGVVIWGSAGVRVPDEAPPPPRPMFEAIAFCGSLRFRREFEALVGAVTRLNGDRERPIEIRLYASAPYPSPVVSWRGYLEKQALIEELRDVDLAYSPLGFAAEDRLLVETSFPSKIATYLRAGIPVLAHAPGYATNAAFVSDNQVGLAISSLDPEAIADALRAYEKALPTRRQHAENTRAALARHFAIATRREFFGAFGGARREPPSGIVSAAMRS